MAMLAEPKRRQKYGNDPRNTFWSNDESKFGFRMLESMGWKKGRGLGANESGITEHVKTVKRSNADTRGVGCSKSHADNWIAHQDVFNELLSSLNDAPSSSAAGSEETPSVVSLEEKSKSSRSRVHYHKFTRGKDLSSRSSHDLDCIFGKRKGQSSENSTPTTQSEANSDEDYEARPSFKLDTSTAGDSNNNDDSNVHGVKTITSSTSVHEYFAMKMAELKRKKDAATGSGNASADGSEGSNSPDNTESNREESKDEPAAMVCGESACAGESKTRRRKKSKKASMDCEEESPPGHNEGRAEVSQADPEASSGALEVMQSQKAKKKSKKEGKKQDASAREADANEVRGGNSLTDERPVSVTGKKGRKKSKKRRSTERGECEERDCNNTSILRSEKDSRTRRRKSVRFSLGADEVFTIPGKEESTPEGTVQREEEGESSPMEEERVSKKRKKKIKMEEAAELEAEVSKKMKKREEAIEEKVSDNKRKKKAATEEEASAKRKREATEEEASAKRKKREEATEENISVKNGEGEEKVSRKKKKKKREEATEEEASAERKKREEAEEETVSKKKKKTEEVDGENVSRKREREGTHSEEEGLPESKKLRVNKPAAVVSSCVKAELEGGKDSVLPAPQKTQSTPVNDVPCSQRSTVKRRAVKKPTKLSQDHIDRIHQRFEGTNLNCFSGYGQ